MQKKLESNIWKYALILITNKRVFIAIIGSYYLTIPDVTPWWVGTFMFIGSLASFIFEIPSGYISDKMGHKNGLVLSKILLVLSSAFLLFSDSILPTAIGTALWSVGFAFHSGTGSAFLFETLKALKKEKDYTKISGKLASIGFAIPVALMASVPFLVAISFKLPFLVTLLIDSTGLIAAISLTKPPVAQKQIEEVGATNFKQVLQAGHTLKFFRYSFFFGALGGLLMAGNGFRAPYQELVEIPIIWFGVLFGIGRLTASILLAYSEKMRRIFNTIRNFSTMLLILYSTSLLGLGISDIWWVIATLFIIINAFQWGLSQVQGGYMLDIIHDNNFKATLLSVGAQIGSIYAAVAAFVLGYAIETFSYRAAFLMLSIAFIVLLLPSYILILKDPRSGAKTMQ